MEIVGLKNFIHDDVNKLIAKFVGRPVHPTAKLINEHIREYEFNIYLFNRDWDFLKHIYVNHMLWKYCSSCHYVMDHIEVRKRGGRCPHCDIHWYDFTYSEIDQMRMLYSWNEYPDVDDSD